SVRLLHGFFYKLARAEISHRVCKQSYLWETLSMNWTTTQDGQQYILELTKMIIAEQAPDEAPLVDELVAIYFDNPAPPKQADSARDDPMGSGLSETLIAFSPVIAAMLKKMLDY